MPFVGTLLEEFSASIGKLKVKIREQSFYSFAVLQLFGGFVFFAVLTAVKRDLFVFSVASLPTLLLRFVLETLQVYATIYAIIRADRSTYGFIRVGTMPLLLAVDVAMGYAIRATQIFGIGLILASILLVFLGKKFGKAGTISVIISTVNAVVTISLYKYNITNFNTVAAEQLVMLGLLSLFFIIMAFTVGRENPFKLITKPIYFGQAVSVGLASLLESFAYALGPASVILAAKRASAVFWAMAAGNLYFHERHFLFKLTVFALLAGGIILLII